MKRRVVVTGLGVVSCFGSDVEKYHQALIQGKSGDPIFSKSKSRFIFSKFKPQGKPLEVKEE